MEIDGYRYQHLNKIIKSLSIVRNQLDEEYFHAVEDESPITPDKCEHEGKKLGKIQSDLSAAIDYFKGNRQRLYRCLRKERIREEKQYHWWENVQVIDMRNEIIESLRSIPDKELTEKTRKFLERIDSVAPGSEEETMLWESYRL